MHTGPLEGVFLPLFVFPFFPPRLPFLFCFCSVWGGGWEIGVFKSSKHTWARKRSTVRRGTSSSHSHHLQLYGRDGCIGVWKAQDACWVAGSAPSCLNLLRSKAALPWDPVGLPLPRPQRERDGTWLVSHPRCTEKQSAGQSWPVPGRAEWWSSGKPLALWIWTQTRRAYHFRCNHFWTCFCRQSLTLKTQRMGNSRGLSFKTDFGDPLIVRYCKVTLRVS